MIKIQLKKKLKKNLGITRNRFIVKRDEAEEAGSAPVSLRRIVKKSAKEIAMHDNIDQPNKRNQSEGDFPKDTGNYDDSKHDDRQNMRYEERRKKETDKNAEKVQA
jgi:hypothetical protein